MNIDELRSAQSKERQKSDLQQLRESFYGDVADYVEELEAERERVAERTEDPFGSPEVQQLTNDIETAKDTAEAIYERRLGKIVKKASLVSAEMANPNDVNGLTTEEQALFSDLVSRIEANKDHMLDVIAGDAPAGPADRSETASGANPTAEADAAAGSSDATTDASASSDASVPHPHPEDGLGADSEDEGADSRPDRSEAAAVAGDDDPTDDGSSARGRSTPDPADVSAADLMGGDADAGSDEPNAEASDGTATDSDVATTADSDPAPSDATPPDATTDAGPTGESSADSGDDEADGASDRATLRVTRDVGEIFGVDEREYTLDAEDVVTLPEENADVLVSQGAAERLD